jgi:hypothetical protein
MTEIKDEESRLIHYEGLEIEITRDPKDRSFYLRVPSDDPEYEVDGAAEADFNDGIVLGYRGQEPVLESGILGIENVHNYDAPAGTATKLIKFGIEEGRRKEFSLGRSAAFNPRIVSIYEKLATEGVINQRHYFTRLWDEERHVMPTVEELLATGKECTAQEAITFLQSFEAGPDGFVHDALVDCIVEF